MKKPLVIIPMIWDRHQNKLIAHRPEDDMKKIAADSYDPSNDDSLDHGDF